MSVIPRYLNARDTAEYLSIGVTMLAQLVEAGRLPKPIEFSARVKRWDREAIDKAIADGTAALHPREDIDELMERAANDIARGTAKRRAARS